MRFTEKYDLSRTQWERLIDEWIFNEDHRRMVKRKLLDGLSYEKVAKDVFDYLRSENIEKMEKVKRYLSMYAR